MAQRLLKYFLANADRTLPFDKIVDVFWPEVESEKGRHNLATQLSAIRRGLGTQLIFPRTGDSCRLCAEGEITVDVIEFERCCRTGPRLLSAGETAKGESALLRAEQLYRGDFLADDIYEDWIEARRQELRTLYEEVLECLGDHFVRRGQYDLALPRYRKLLCCDEPLDQVFHKTLRCYEALGDRPGARREFESFRAKLEALGLEPQASIVALMAPGSV